MRGCKQSTGWGRVRAPTPSTKMPKSAATISTAARLLRLLERAATDAQIDEPVYDAIKHALVHELEAHLEPELANSDHNNQPQTEPETDTEAEVVDAKTAIAEELALVEAAREHDGQVPCLGAQGWQQQVTRASSTKQCGI